MWRHFLRVSAQMRKLDKQKTHANLENVMPHQAVGHKLNSATHTDRTKTNLTFGQLTAKMQLPDSYS